MLILIRNPETNEYGYTSTFFGSCCVCDNIQRIEYDNYNKEDYEDGADPKANDLKDILNDIRISTVWKGTKKELREYLENKDWELDARSYYEGFKESIDKLIDSLR